MRPFTETTSVADKAGGGKDTIAPTAPRTCRRVVPERLPYSDFMMRRSSDVVIQWIRTIASGPLQEMNLPPPYPEQTTCSALSARHLVPDDLRRHRDLSQG